MRCWKRDAGANDLAKALAADIETPEGRGVARDGLKAELTGKSPAEVKQQAIATLTRVGQILDAKAPADTPAFKAWLKHFAKRNSCLVARQLPEAVDKYTPEGRLSVIKVFETASSAN
jgi:hypothetical protein